MKFNPRFGIILPFLVLCLIKPSKLAAQVKEHTLFWKITGNGLSKPSYLFGTIHLYDTVAYQLPRPVFDTLKHVDQVYFELDFGHLDLKKMMSALYIKDTTQYLNHVLDRKSLEKLKKIVLNSALMNAMGPALYKVKPFYIPVLLMMGPKTTSLDMELYKAALVCKDSVAGLETLDEQLAAVESIPVSTQVKLLEEAISKFESREQLLAQLTHAYVLQDADHLMEQLGKEMPTDENFNKQLVTQRNLVMAERISKLPRSKSFLIAVGAGHLGTSLGLVDLLRKQGFTLTPLTFKFQKK